MVRPSRRCTDPSLPSRYDKAVIMYRACSSVIRCMYEQVNKMDQAITIEGAKVTTADLKCSNGYIHVIDTVLVPK